MKKLLALLGALSLTATATTTVIACGNKKPKKVDLDQYLTLARQEANQKNLNIEAAIKKIRAISKLPQGLVKSISK